MKIRGKEYRTVWMQGRKIMMINQPLLPHLFRIVRLNNYLELRDAIRNMTVRGAPAIGAAAAYGAALAALSYRGNIGGFRKHFDAAARDIMSARPTAHDLSDGVRFVQERIKGIEDLEGIRRSARAAAEEYAERSIEACKMIGVNGNKLIRNGSRILTHCNAGALATVDYGTALAPIRVAHNSGKKIFVYSDETRPRQQGSQLTAFELSEEGIPHAIIADNAAGYFMKKGMIDLCIVGADRIALNGDFANKIGTYEKAVLAKENGIPFYVAAPLSTFDRHCRSGDCIPIEERDEDEVLYAHGWSDSGRFERVRTSPKKSHAKNPAFDVTPARYVTGFITPSGIIRPGLKSIRDLLVD